MSAPVDVLAVIRRIAREDYLRGLDGFELTAAADAVAELVSDVEPLIASLLSIIDKDNCMTQQAIMVQRAAASLKRGVFRLLRDLEVERKA